MAKKFSFPEIIPDPATRDNDRQNFVIDSTHAKENGSYSRNEFQSLGLNQQPILKKLDYFTKKSVIDLRQSHDLKKISSAPKRLKKLMKEQNVGDDVIESSLYELRYKGNPPLRFFGILRGNCFFIYLFDPKHDLLKT